MGDLRDNREESRFELEEGGATAWADYRLQGERLYLDYVFAPPELRGTGAAGRLMAAVAGEARARGLSITPICGYAAAWLRRSPQFRDLVGEPARPGGGKT
jgi:predicted GNAT family acetyltransferase